MFWGWGTSLRPGEMNRGYTQEIAKATKYGEFITVAAYNGGWDEGEGPPRPVPASWFNVLSQVNQTAIPRFLNFNAVMDATNKRLGRTLGFGTYEAGPGYALNGMHGTTVTRDQANDQELVMKSKLAGVATLDSFLSRIRYGSTIENFFTFEAGDMWKSHAKKHRGGQPHASFLPVQMFNHIGTGQMLLVSTDNVSTVDTPKAKKRAALDNGPMAAVYAMRDGDRVTVICINRMYPDYPQKGHDGITPFTVKLPFTAVKSVTLHRMSGDPTDNNINSENVKAVQETLPASALAADGTFTINETTGGVAGGMPPAELFMYVSGKSLDLRNQYG